MFRIFQDISKMQSFELHLIGAELKKQETFLLITKKEQFFRSNRESY